MASHERPKLPRATLRDQKLYVEGEQEPYFQDREHVVRLRVDALTVHPGSEPAQYSNWHSNQVVTESIHGIATIEQGERFAVIGLDGSDRTTSIKFHLRPISDPALEFEAKIGFHVYDPEFPDLKEGFWIQGYFRRQLFDELLTALVQKGVDYINLGLKTRMWTIDTKTWHVEPPTDDEPTSEPGFIYSLTWAAKRSTT
jgi:hypothetical protein